MEHLLCDVSDWLEVQEVEHAYHGYKNGDFVTVIDRSQISAEAINHSDGQLKTKTKVKQCSA
jgi:hypothetical protein